jgi:hypothetical protein
VLQESLRREKKGSGNEKKGFALVRLSFSPLIILFATEVFPSSYTFVDNTHSVEVDYRHHLSASSLPFGPASAASAHHHLSSLISDRLPIIIQSCDLLLV